MNRNEGWETLDYERALRIMLVLLVVVWVFLFVMLRPRLLRHSEVLTIIDTRVGEIDINHVPGHSTTIWYQDMERGINVRLLLLPW
jgi:hypothetical protein